MNNPCAFADEVQSLLAGNSDASRVDELIAHVEQCPTCRQMVEDSASNSGSSIPTTQNSLEMNSEDQAILSRIRQSPLYRQNAGTDSVEQFPNIPGFEIEECLGSGGQGAVYRARQIRLGRVVALKIIGPRTRVIFREHLTRFQTEAQAIARLEHPNIVRIYEIAEHESLPYLVLEYIDGGTLKGLLDRGELPVKDAVQIVLKVAQAAHFAHSRGVVHSDLKPRNVLLTKDGTPKISDFGLARLIGPESEAAILSHPIGTKEYMSPEQWSAAGPTVDARSDQWSLGVILFELLCGHRPFNGDSPAEISQAIRSGLTPPLHPARSQNWPDLQAICHRCLEKNPDDRYPSCQHLADDLHRWLNNEPVTVRAIPPSERARKWCQRNPILATLYAVGASLMIAVALASIFRSQAENAKLQATIAKVQEELANQERIKAEVAARISRATSSASEAGRLVQSGQWSKAIASFDSAISEGHPDAARQKLEKIKCLLYLGKSAEAAHQLKQLSDKNLPTDVQAEIDEWRGFALIGTKTDEGFALLKRALKSGQINDNAELEFMEALCADNLNAAVDHYNKALEFKPYHQIARQMLCVSLYFLGKLDDSARHAEIAMSFNPGDLGNAAFLAVIHHLQHNREASESLLRSIEQSESAEFAVKLRKLLKMIDELQELTPQSVMSPLFAFRVPQWAAIVMDLKDEMVQSVPLPPQINLIYTNALDFATKLTKDPTATLEIITANHKERTFLVLLGQMYASKGDYQKARSAFEEADTLPGFVQTQTVIDYYLARIYWQLSFGAANDDVETYKKRSIYYLERLMSAAKLPTNVGQSEMEHFATTALEMESAAAIRKMIPHWKLMKPDDPAIPYYDAMADLKEGRTSAAYEKLLESKRLGANAGIIEQQLTMVRELLRRELQKSREILAESDK